jgi:hypothetical protein
MKQRTRIKHLRDLDDIESTADLAAPNVENLLGLAAIVRALLEDYEVADDL